MTYLVQCELARDGQSGHSIRTVQWVSEEHAKPGQMVSLEMPQVTEDQVAIVTRAYEVVRVYPRRMDEDHLRGPRESNRPLTDATPEAADATAGA